MLEEQSPGPEVPLLGAGSGVCCERMAGGGAELKHLRCAGHSEWVSGETSSDTEDSSV